MVLHVVLFEPKADLADEARSALLASIDAAAQAIPSVRRFEVGRRLADGPAYQVGEERAFSFIAVVAFDDRTGLQTYLAHPAHVALGRLFHDTLARALVYDYEAHNVGDGLDVLAHR
jgi:hypothetical protein